MNEGCVRGVVLSAFLCLFAGSALCEEGPSRREERAVVFPAGSATLSPRVQAALQTLVRDMAAEAQVSVVGRDDDGSSMALAEARAKMLGAALRAAGVARSRIVIQQETTTPGSQAGAVSHIRWSVPASASTATSTVTSAVTTAVATPESARVPEPAPALQRFDILASDGDLSRTLRRWGVQHGYLVVWEAPTQAAVQGDMSLDAPSFLDAVAQLMGGLQSAGYPLKALHEGKNVVRISALR